MQASLQSVPGHELPQELDDLFQEHYHLVYCTAYGILGRVEDAEDVVQSIFLRLLQRETPANLSPNPRGYLYRAAVNQALTIVKTRQRRERSHVSEELAAAVPARASTDAEDVHRRLYEAIAQLNEKSASMLILRYLHNFSDKEIATLLGTSRGVIAVTLYRARARLKKLMGNALGENDEV